MRRANTSFHYASGSVEDGDYFERFVEAGSLVNDDDPILQSHPESFTELAPSQQQQSPRPPANRTRRGRPS
jgi:hypothetical protein